MTVRHARRASAAIAACALAGGAACTAILGIGDRSLDPLLDAGEAGACGDTSSDTHNCGRCGHDCLGGACSAGVCQPLVLVAPDSGARPSHLVVQGQYVYWSDSVNDAINRTDTKSLQTTNIYYGGFDLDGLALDDAGIYFADVSSVYRCNIGGCAGTADTLAPDGSTSGTPWFVAVDDNGVYWDDSDTMDVHTVPKMGGTVRTIYTGPGDAGLAYFRADGRYVYVAGADGTVVRIPEDGGAPQQMNPGLQLPSAWELALDSQNLYWSQDDPNLGPGTINVVGLNSQSPRTFATNQPIPSGIAADSQNLYWTNFGTNADSQSGSVVTCPLSSCTSPLVLATGQHIPRNIALDDVAVYWANFGNGDNDGSLVRVAKP